MLFALGVLKIYRVEKFMLFGCPNIIYCVKKSMLFGCPKNISCREVYVVGYPAHPAFTWDSPVFFKS